MFQEPRKCETTTCYQCHSSFCSSANFSWTNDIICGHRTISHGRSRFLTTRNTPNIKTKVRRNVTLGSRVEKVIKRPRNNQVSDNYEVPEVYLDGASASEIMYEHCFRQLPQEIQKKLKSTRSSLVGFHEEKLWPIGVIAMEVTLGGDKWKQIKVNKSKIK